MGFLTTGVWTTTSSKGVQLRLRSATECQLEVLVERHVRKRQIPLTLWLFDIVLRPRVSATSM